MQDIGYNTRCDSEGLQAARLVPEPSSQYSLSAGELNKTQAQQLQVFAALEKGLDLFDGGRFKSQVHFQFAHRTPVQRWYPYREGYSIGLVDAFIRELGVSSNTFDPFSGSGTTLLASRMNNLKSYGIDVNPISVLVAQVENEQYEQQDVDALRLEIETIRALPPSEGDFATAFHLADRVFNEEILTALLQFKHHIQAIADPKVRLLVFAAWLSIIEDVSNIKKEGNGIKYKNRRRTPTGYVSIEKQLWEQKNLPQDRFAFVKAKLIGQLALILDDLEFRYGLCAKKPEVFLGSCLAFEEHFSADIELSFFSPPYCNCFDYFEIHKVELWLGDFVNSHEDMRALRTSGLRSNTNTLNNKPVIYHNESLEKLVSMFNSASLWSTRIPAVVRGYFDDMHTLLGGLCERTRKGGFVGIVVGNSAYSGVIIPTDLLIAEIAREIGFTVKGVLIVRHLTTSSQQKKELMPLRNHLRESIVLLTK